MIVMCSLLIAVRCYEGMRCAMSNISQYTLTTAMAKINEPCRNIYTNCGDIFIDFMHVWHIKSPAPGVLPQYLST